MERLADPALSPRFSFRLAEPADNAALLRLTAACPMRAAVSICVRREPDFFALSRLQGDPWYVLLAETPTGELAACLGYAVRELFLDGAPQKVIYAGDLKVAPPFRRQGLPVQLATAGFQHCSELGLKLPVFMTALAGNRPVEHRLSTPPPDLPQPRRLGRIRVHTLLVLGLCWPRPPAGVTVQPARPEDLPAMSALWAKVAPQRQGAPLLDLPRLERWLAQAPGLCLADYLLAWRGKELVGQLGLWDQESFKRTLVLDYDRTTRTIRRGYNLLAGFAGWPSLPRPAETLRALHAIHLCVLPGQPAALRALLLAARRRCADLGLPSLELGLDPGDPLSRGLKGLPGIGTDVICYLTGRMAAGEVATGKRPVHYETALV